jgi:hypothetical protein
MRFIGIVLIQIIVTSDKSEWTVPAFIQPQFDASAKGNEGERRLGD